jgi:predicted hydrocarbon binding protein
MEHLIDNYPPNNLNRQFDFADFASLDRALDDMVGPRGGRALSLRAGQAVFSQGLQGFASFVGMADLAFRLLPLGTKLKVGLKAMAEVFTKFSDQKSSVIEKEDRYLYVIERCPVCWGRHAEKPICHVATGLLQEGVKWVSGGKIYKIQETLCIAKGDPTCTFEIAKQPIS